MTVSLSFFITKTCLLIFISLNYIIRRPYGANLPRSSNFVSLTPSGNIERLDPEDLTPNLINAIKQADEYKKLKQLEKRLSNQNQYEKNPKASPIIKTIVKTIQNENRPKPKPGIIPFDERTNLLK